MKTSRTKTSRWPSRNDTWTEVYAGNVHSTFVHARTLVRCFVLHIRKGKGSVPSLTCRRLEGERTIAGAERTRQLRSMMFFLGFWNSLTPLSVLSTYLPLSTITSFTLPPFFRPVCFSSLFISPVFLSPRGFREFPPPLMIILSLFCRGISSTKIRFTMFARLHTALRVLCKILCICHCKMQIVISR